jgi:replicative DNA helicase
MEKVENLKKFGIDFQQKCLSAIISDKTFVERISDIIQYQFFETEACQWICKESLSYFLEYKTVPTLTVFKVKIDSVTNEALKLSYIDTLKQVYSKSTSNDLEFVKEEFLMFCKNQILKKAILDSVEHLNSGEYDKIKQVVDFAMKAGMERNVGHIYDENISTRMTLVNRNCVKTLIPQIDTLTDGGIGAGELIIFCGGPGSCKSWILQILGAAALNQCKKVLHVTLELSEDYTGLRYDAIHTGIPFTDVRKHEKEVREAVSSIGGKLFVKYFPPKSASTLTIKNLIEQLAVLGHKIDVLIVDYPDLLKSSSGTATSSYSDAGDIYTELRGLAGEYKIPCIGASQLNRAGSQAKVAEGHDLADSFQKLMIADILISVSRQRQDKVAGTARIHLVKNRFGADGLVFPAKLDASIGKLELFDPESAEGIALQNLMDATEEQEEIEIKKRLHSKFREIQEKKEMGQ